MLFCERLGSGLGSKRITQKEGYRRLLCVKFNMNRKGKEVEEAVIKSPLSVSCWLDYVLYRERAGAGIQTVCAIFERACYHLPGSYKLWHSYLRHLVRDARGRPLDHSSYAKANDAFSRCLQYMHKMPRIWLDYADFLQSQFLISDTRKVFDRALRALPCTQHDRIWKKYLSFVQDHAEAVPSLGMHVFPRYLEFQPSHREHFVEYLIQAKQYARAMTELSIVLRPKKGKRFRSVHGKTLHDLWMDLANLIVSHAEEASEAERNGLNVEAIMRQGTKRFSDECGNLWCLLAQYYIKLGSFDRAKDIYEEAMVSVRTLIDFSAVFDAYTGFLEALVDAKVDIFDGHHEATGEDDPFYELNIDTENKIDDVDLHLRQLEHLLEQRLFLVNSVLLRQNPHNCDTWHARAQLFKDRDGSVEMISVYEDAMGTVDLSLATGRPYSLWAALGHIYENNGDLDAARKVFSEGLKQPFAQGQELIDLYALFVEMELRNENYETALGIVQQALLDSRERENQHVRESRGGDDEGKHLPRSTLHRYVRESTKLWGLYIDLEESIGTFKSVRAGYSKMIELKIATPRTILNYAVLLQKHQCYEDAFQIFERGVSAFDWPSVGEIWLSYLSSFTDYFKGEHIHRTRELFDTALSKAPGASSAPLYLLLVNFEESFGDPSKVLAAFDRLCHSIPQDDDRKPNFFLAYIAKSEELFGIDHSRQIYEKAIENVKTASHICRLCVNYAEKECRVGEIDRARAIFQYAASFADPRKETAFWNVWHSFEVSHGDRDTFREMLRMKRSIQATYQDTNYNIAPVDVHPPERHSQDKDVADTENAAPSTFSSLSNEVTFKPSRHFDGPIHGFVFKTGDKGLGYYREEAPRAQVTGEGTSIISPPVPKRAKFVQVPVPSTLYQGNAP